VRTQRQRPISTDERAERGDALRIDFLPFTDLAQSVRDDVAFLRSSALIPAEIPIHGFVYDVRTGRVSEVASGAGERSAAQSSDCSLRYVFELDGDRIASLQIVAPR
jgi:carbonic anhydrase